MSVWRRSALEKLPAFRSVIQKAENPMMLWIELGSACTLKAYAKDPPDDRTLRGIFDYARWCLHGNDDNVRTAVVVSFYEHIPKNPRIRNDLHRWMTTTEFEELESAFRYFLSGSEYEVFRRNFIKAKEKSAPTFMHRGPKRPVREK